MGRPVGRNVNFPRHDLANLRNPVRLTARMGLHKRTCNRRLQAVGWDAGE